jgi:hypothetical protein
MCDASLAFPLRFGGLRDALGGQVFDVTHALATNGLGGMQEQRRRAVEEVAVCAAGACRLTLHASARCGLRSACCRLMHCQSLCAISPSRGWTHAPCGSLPEHRCEQRPGRSPLYRRGLGPGDSVNKCWRHSDVARLELELIHRSCASGNQQGRTERLQNKHPTATRRFAHSLHTLNSCTCFAASKSAVSTWRRLTQSG